MTPKENLPPSYPQKIYFAKKMVQNGHLWPQQLPIHSTPAYTGSRPPTRWSISSISERSSGWAINYSQRVVAAVSLFVNRETAMLSMFEKLTLSFDWVTLYRVYIHLSGCPRQHCGLIIHYSWIGRRQCYLLLTISICSAGWIKEAAKLDPIYIGLENVLEFNN